VAVAAKLETTIAASSIEAARRIVRERAGSDSYPDEHAVGVARYADRIAEQLHLDANSRVAVVGGALLHDVGKLLIDARILRKPGPLTGEERDEVETHPVAGERLVRDAVEPEVAVVVRAHHERWDGAGYPHGLTAEEIPLAARIVAVADAFLAMLEVRPYRLPIEEDAAVDELKRGAGSQFDPRCVDALLRVLGSACRSTSTPRLVEGMDSHDRNRTRP
jgi:HD-GYP domain-containing protein (c-di-GMP phosphodiesterase class II)